MLQNLIENSVFLEKGVMTASKAEGKFKEIVHLTQGRGYSFLGESIITFIWVGGREHTSISREIPRVHGCK